MAQSEISRLQAELNTARDDVFEKVRCRFTRAPIRKLKYSFTAFPPTLAPLSHYLSLIPVRCSFPLSFSLSTGSPPFSLSTSVSYSLLPPTLTPQSAEQARLLEARDAASRMLLESLTRTVGEVQGALRSTADEVRQTLKSIATRLTSEIERIKSSEREAAAEQLTRLLAELGGMTTRIGELQSEVTQARRDGGSNDALLRKLEFYRDDERSCRAALTLAASELNIGLGGDRAPLSEELGTVLGHYRRVSSDVLALSASLDVALQDVMLNNLENSNLAEKVNLLLSNYSKLRREAEYVRTSLDWALSEMKTVSDDHQTLSQKLRLLIDEVKNTSTSEAHLRVALKRQHGSLHYAYQRLKAVEAELVRSQGTAAEERETLVNAALNALQQLRNSLGAVHAIRPEIAKPLDEALVVKNVRLMRHSASSPGIGGSEVGGSGMQQQQQPVGTMMTGQEEVIGGGRHQLDTFMHRIAATAGALIVGVDPAGVVNHASRSTPHDPFGAGRRHPAQGGSKMPPMQSGSSPDWSAQYSQAGTIPRGMGPRLRPLTPGLSSSPSWQSSYGSPSLTAVGPATLRVPQPRVSAMKSHPREHLQLLFDTPVITTFPSPARATRSILPHDIEDGGTGDGSVPRLNLGSSRPSSAKAQPA